MPAKSGVDMHAAMVTHGKSKTPVARALALSFDMVTSSTWQESPATWGYNTFLVAPWMSLEAWRPYQKKAVMYTRWEVLAGSARHKATKSERLPHSSPFYLVAAACIRSTISYHM